MIKSLDLKAHFEKEMKKMKTIAFELEVNIFKRNEAFIKTAKCNGFANNALVYMHLHM